MFQTIALWLLAGLLGVDSLPHLVTRLIGREFPPVLGNSPLHNALAGPTGLVLTAALVATADMPSHPWATAWLLSDRASYVTGALVPVDGGMTA